MQKIETKTDVVVAGRRWLVRLQLITRDDETPTKTKEIISGECERLLPAWIKSKIERGEP